VIISEGEELYQHKLIKGIISECYSLDYDVAVFSTFVRDIGPPEYKIGEKNIYNLINFDRFDGIIVVGITLAIENLFQEIEDMLRTRCKCPVLYIDMSSEYFPCIYTNDRRAMEELTDHLIERHGIRDIFCLAADPGSPSTINRVAGFKDSLAKHHIAFDESKISYSGEFYYPSGERLANDIVSGNIPRPQAVMCINDYMAIGMINAFEKLGIRVPEDIVITGYDATDEAAFCSTVVSSYSAPVMETGVEAVCELTKLMTGKRPEPVSVNLGHLELGRSCGCYDVDYLKRSTFHRLRKKTEDYKILLDSYMMEALTSVIDFKDCIKKFSDYLYLIKDYSDYYLCLCDNWDGSYHNYSDDKDMTIQIGYTNKMTMVMECEKTQFKESNYTFSTGDMLPDLWKDREKPKAYYFTPLHFNENTIGYSVLSYGDMIKVFDITYRNWSRYIMNVLEFNRSHRKLYRTSFRDVLTGIYNRRGFDQNLPSIVNEVKSQNKMLQVIMADLDNLKHVNDRYGHQEGDNIITVVANAFQSCSKENEICARIGGDEFLVAGVYDDNYQVQNFIDAVYHYIDNYNMKSKKPYEIQISMGNCGNYVNDDKDIKEIIDCADHQMYMNKARNKQRKNNV